jgi:heme exporter protein C
MKKSFPLLFVLGALMLLTAPFLIARAPYESTMLLVQKIFYYHAPSGQVMLVSGLVCGIASAIFLWRRKPGAEHVAIAAGELTALFGLIVLTSGPLWGRRRGASGGCGTRG